MVFVAIWSFSNLINVTLEEILSFVTKKSSTECSKQLVIDYSNRILFQILFVKICSHIFVVHLISGEWHGNKKDDVEFLLQAFIHMTTMINDIMTWMSEISHENVTKIKSFQI
jgi:hypothetical protein